ncbi:hypothetical protein M7I_3134 [Glarea lozoyensis 74030]|uniref:Uncharacterized protein n=1 Tax=Glarea lozoyensis (strain ATCC 74030 / MF5533) TaxID=1104152 RepID=H0EKQ5_GLAL7|nr:hypothetical protein M7I_3134 [Glarea lozoyensis 74030]
MNSKRNNPLLSILNLHEFHQPQHSQFTRLDLRRRAASFFGDGENVIFGGVERRTGADGNLGSAGLGVGFGYCKTDSTGCTGDEHGFFNGWFGEWGNVWALQEDLEFRVVEAFYQRTNWGVKFDAIPPGFPSEGFTISSLG